MVDAPRRLDPPLGQSRMIVEELCERAIGEGDMVHTRRSTRLLAEAGDMDEGDAVVFVVISEEGDAFVLERHRAVQDEPIPVDHLLEARCLENDMGQLDGRDDPVRTLRGPVPWGLCSNHRHLL
nr:MULTISPECIES: hypothetical protein [unclassified Sphingomonas]